MTNFNNDGGSPGKIRIYHSHHFPKNHVLFRLEEIEFAAISGPTELKPQRSAVLLFDKVLAEKIPAVKAWKEAFHGHLIVISEDGLDEGDYLVPVGWPSRYCLKALESIMREMVLRSGRELLNEALVKERGKMMQLTNIGLALSAETQLSRLLDMILSEGRSFACCDAASLFLVDKKTDGKESELVFKLSQNDSVNVPFNETRFPIDKTSIAGFVAVTGQTLNIPDVYDLNGKTPYRFNKSFDEDVGYYSRSMLTIPMKNHGQEVIGVLQFINRKKNKSTRLLDKSTTLANTLPFTRDLIVLLEALASQAAVAIDNSVLLRRIKRLFEGFVSAAVTAIEQRDPTTSGHSFRVADLTTRLAQIAPLSGHPKFKDFHPDKDQLREIRYASLLHDFGKVGVREDVLLKKKKLPHRGLDLIWHRFEIRKEQLRNASLNRQIQFLAQKGQKAYQLALPEFERRLAEELGQLKKFFKAIERANEPTVLDEGNVKNLEEIKAMGSFTVGKRKIAMLNDSEFLALSLRRGSLTPEERFEIQNHVVHTYNFLKEIPWTPELSRIPEIAGAHHEKNNGKGYPHGLAEEEIPLASKMMTIADIYDALTASDRPYKRALAPEEALRILEDEAKQGFIDRDLVSVFIEAEVYKSNGDFVPAKEMTTLEEIFHRNVCDYDLDTIHTH